MSLDYQTESGSSFCKSIDGSIECGRFCAHNQIKHLLVTCLQGILSPRMA